MGCCSLREKRKSKGREGGLLLRRVKERKSFLDILCCTLAFFF